MRKRAPPQSEGERLTLGVGEFIAKRLSTIKEEARRKLLRTPWRGLNYGQQDDAVRTAFVAGALAEAEASGVTYRHFVSVLTKRTAPPTPRSDSRPRAFHLGQSRTPRDLLHLLVRPWTSLDRAEQVLVGDLAEYLGRQPLAALVPLVELIARLPRESGEDPLEDERIRALEQGANRPLALDAALHRLGLLDLPNVDVPKPRPQSEALRDLAVGALRGLSDHDETWRSFPGIWIALLYPGRPTAELFFLSPEGKDRRNPKNFSGAWVALACDCFLYAASCEQGARANLAAIAGCALLALAPRDDAFKSRKKLHLADDVARLAEEGSRVAAELRDVARRLSEAEPLADVNSQAIVTVLSAHFADRSAPSVVRAKRAPKGPQHRELRKGERDQLEARFEELGSTQAAHAVALKALEAEFARHRLEHEQDARVANAEPRVQRRSAELDRRSAPGVLLELLRLAHARPAGHPNGRFVSEGEWRVAIEAAGVDIASGYSHTSAASYLKRWLRKAEIRQIVVRAPRQSPHKGYELRDLPKSEG